MDVEQKLFETWCGEYCQPYHKNWEGYCMASGGYINGFKAFRERMVADLKAKYNPNTGDYFFSIDHFIELLEKFGEEKHTVFIKDHQLGSKSTDGGQAVGAE